jgi:4-hydroxy-tetrahydrodipicolinate synthase
MFRAPNDAKPMEEAMFEGSITALITPFKNGELDKPAFQSFVEWQILEGTNALVPCGTTGESPTLSHDEHRDIIETCIDVADGKVPVIAGTGSNSTREAIELTHHAKQAGASAALVVTPYYNKPTQDGLIAHYTAIHDECCLPIIIYNIPGRSVIDMSVETMAKLAKLPNIVGVKDATSDLTRPLETRLACGASFCQLSGEDGIAVPFLAAGGVGCISVTANIAPKMCSDMHSAWRAGDLDTVMTLQDTLTPIHNSMFCETNPGPVKYAASLLGKCAPDTRLPLVDTAQSSKYAVRSALEGAGLLN